MSYAIIVKEISKSYLHKSKAPANLADDFSGKKKVLDDISINIPKGQVCGIVGINGSGKSTLLKIISGILKPDSGHIVVEGKHAAILELGTGFHPELTGRDNIYFNALVLGYKKQHVRAVIDDIINFSELGDYIDMPVKTYSSGMYMRLAFSIVVHLKADLLLLDEVFSVGDPEFRIKCMEKLLYLRDSDTTILLVSHDFHQVSLLCDRCILLKEGKVVKDGLPSEVIDYFVSSFFNKLNSTDQLAPKPIYIWEDDTNNFVTKAEVISHSSFTYHRSDPVKLGFNFVKNSSDPLFVSFVLYYRFDDLAFASSTVYNYDYSPSDKLSYSLNESGHYSLTCIIPPNLLNIGKFMLGLYIVNEKGGIVLTINNLCIVNIINDPEGECPRIIETLPSHFPIFAKADWEITKMNTTS